MFKSITRTKGNSNPAPVKDDDGHCGEIAALAAAIRQSGESGVTVTKDGKVSTYSGSLMIWLEFESTDVAIRYLSGTVAARGEIIQKIIARNQAKALEAGIEKMQAEHALALEKMYA